MQGVQVYTNSFGRKSKAIALMEKCSGEIAKNDIAVSQNYKKELIKFYKIQEKKLM